MSNELKVAVIGAGYWGQTFLRRLNSLPSWKTQVVVDRNLNHQAEVRRLLAGQPLSPSESTQIADSDSAVTSELARLDVAFVMTPVEGRLELVKRLLKLRVPLFITKPLALSSAEAKEIEACASSLNIPVFVDHTFLFHPHWPVFKAEFQRKGLRSFGSERRQMGKQQKSSSVFWELAYHDLYLFLDLYLGHKDMALFEVRVSDLAWDKGFLCEGRLYVCGPEGLSFRGDYSMTSPVKVRRFYGAKGDSDRQPLLEWDDVDWAQKHLREGFTLDALGRQLTEIERFLRRRKCGSGLDDQLGDYLKNSFSVSQSVTAILERAHEQIPN